MSIRELTWQIDQAVFEAQNFTGILLGLRIFSLKTYEISDSSFCDINMFLRPFYKSGVI